MRRLLFTIFVCVGLLGVVACHPYPANGTLPTRANTGPGPNHTLTNTTPEAVLSSKVCNNQRIVGDLNFTDASVKGQTYDLNNCEITGRIYVYLESGGETLPKAEMPLIDLDRVDVLGGIILINAAKLVMNWSYSNGGLWATDDDIDGLTDAPMPVFIRNSLFHQPQGTPPEHTEALFVADYGTEQIYINTAFVQEGPENGTATATINFHGNGALFDGCWFLWGGEVDAEPATFYTIYVDGPNNVVRNSKLQPGVDGAYLYPESPIDMEEENWTNNTDYNTGQSIPFPL